MKAKPILRSSSILASTAFTCFSSRETSLRAEESICLQDSQLHHPMLTTVGIGPLDKGYLRSLDVAKPGPFNLYLAISPSRGVADLASDVLTLKIAIGPDNQGAGITSL